MPLNTFHLAVSSWFRTEFEGPTEIQLRAWPEIKKHRHALISAPTGSGKTLAAFLAAIDDLIKQGLAGDLSEQTQVVYVSPLKALSNDIERNLQLPLKGIRNELAKAGLPEVKIRVLVRTGDTPSSKRAAMIKHPPHILVTTPESLYLLLTSRNGRQMISNVHTVIVDEIHALVGNKRGSHLALSLERLNRLTSSELVRVGLSATQKPIEKVADFLTGSHGRTKTGKRQCKIINVGHKRELDLAIEVPRSPMTAIMPNEVWAEIYERLEELIKQHQTTLIFVNTRRLTERMAHNLTERLGPEFVTAHHGSMSKEHRLDAEQRLKQGSLRALVATASLELGIDIGSVDLVCQMGSPKTIATFLQRVGRSGHTVKGIPKGRLFPLSRDELVECAAVLDAVRGGELDQIIMPEKPLDILAQQVVAEVACAEYQESDLYELFRGAYPYRHLQRREFDEVIKMLADGFATRNGRRSAYLHRDLINERLRGRRGAQLTALVSGGAIPDNFDFDVILEPTNTFIGTLNEDFAIESMPGDIFQLGNNSWRIMRVENGKVRVENAAGLLPSIPFWFGEAPGRSAELSQAVSRLRENVSDKLGDLENLRRLDELDDAPPSDDWKQPALQWLTDELGLKESAADQIVTYLATAKAALGALPSHKTLIMERFFDEAGDMHLVIHSPFGSRLNRAWGLALRKRFCRKFNFELQAAAAEDSIILSLGATHSFPLDEVYQYLNPKSVRNVLVQALLDSPMFEVRWRWNASRALAVLRRRAGKKVPPAIQRMRSEDLIALIFPDQLACLENIAGEREIPDHPLVNQTIHDCLYEAMNIDELEQLLTRIRDGEMDLIAKDLREPSPLAEEILNARPYAFLDNAPLEERRANAVQTRRWLDPAEAKNLGKLDQAAIDAVKSEVWPQVGNADELHDALVLCAFLTPEEGERGDGQIGWKDHFQELVQDGRAALLETDAGAILLWVAVERSIQMREVYPDSRFRPEFTIPDKLRRQMPNEENALVEVIRGRMEALGPVRVKDLAQSMGLLESQIEQALLALENQGFVFRGHFTPDREDQEWCERRLLARIHRYTLQRLRREIEPVSSADFMRFLFHWHHLAAEDQPEGADALPEVVKQLEGYEAPAAAWEGDILPGRLKNYEHVWLDMLCLSGNTIWGRFRPGSTETNGAKNASPIKSTPIALINRSNLELWRAFSVKMNGHSARRSHAAEQVLGILTHEGACFFDEIVSKTDLLKAQVEDAIAELVALGKITADSFTGLRALLVDSKYRTESGRRRRGHLTFKMEQAGRWSLLATEGPKNENPKLDFGTIEDIARILLRRYGVLFRKVADRENFAPPWRELVRVLRTLEARGEIRGGRFVDGVWGEQYALPEAVAKLRSVRREEKQGDLVSISAVDPLNLTGIITPGRRVSGLFGNRILYRDGVPIAVKEGGEISFLTQFEDPEKWRIQKALVQRNISPKLRAYLGKGVV
ncbi:DEAD/DEAH box helicase [bacterium]|nr:DEAD/DEAH box helicase [bacterium]